MYRDRLKDGAQVSIIDTHMHVSFDRPVNKPVICEFAESMNHCFSGERSWFESLRVASIQSDTEPVVVLLFDISRCTSRAVAVGLVRWIVVSQ